MSYGHYLCKLQSAIIIALCVCALVIRPWPSHAHTHRHTCLFMTNGGHKTPGQALKIPVLMLRDTQANRATGRRAIHGERQRRPQRHDYYCLHCVDDVPARYLCMHAHVRARTRAGHVFMMREGVLARGGLTQSTACGLKMTHSINIVRRFA